MPGLGVVVEQDEKTVEFNDLRDPGGDEFMAQYLLARVQTRISVLTAQMGTLVHSTPFRVQQIVFVALGDRHAGSR